jgi:hypothetical protein
MRIIAGDGSHISQCLRVSVANSGRIHKAKKRLIATPPDSKIPPTRCKKSLSQFLTATNTALPKMPNPLRFFTLSGADGCVSVANPPSRLYPSDRGARMSHSIKQRSAFPGGAIQ